MENVWKWTIASACFLVALILLARILLAPIWLAAGPNVTAPPLSSVPKASQEDAATTTVPEPSKSAPTIIAAATAVETAPPSTPPAAAASARQMAARRQTLEALPKGNIVLHAPSAMRVGERRNVEANVGINVPMEILRKPPHSQDQAIEGTLRISAEMAATLNGPGFKIDAVTPEKQTIAEGFPTVWSWNVEAKEDGEQDLEATLYVILGDDRQRIDSYHQTITVSVREQTWGEWLESIGHEVDAVKAILGTLAAAATIVFGWLGISFARRKGKVATKFGRRRKSPA